MVGFLIGAACLIGLIATLRAGRRHGWGHHHHQHGGGSCGHSSWRGGDRGYRSRGPRGAIRYLFERLDTSPGQEKAILAAVEELWTKRRALTEEFLQTRRDVARAMRGDRFDEVALGEAFTRQDALLAQLRESAGHTMKAVHEALDERQRKLAADILENGFFGGGSRWGGRGDGDGGPYRNAWA